MAFLTGQLWHVLKSWSIDAFLARGDFSRALAFRSLYYPGGKMGTTRSLILVDRWRLKTKISALALRRINQKFSSVWHRLCLVSILGCQCVSGHVVRAKK